MIEIRVDQRQLSDLLGQLESVPKGMAIATSRAANKVLTTTRAEMVRTIRTKYAIKAVDVRKELAIDKMYPAKLVGRIWGESSPGVPLNVFVRMRRVPSTKRTKGGGYTPKIGIPVLVRKDKGKRIVRGAFTAKMRSGHVGAFVRGSRYKQGRKTSKSQLGAREITELFGPTPVKLLGGKEVLAAIEQYANLAMDKNLRHEAEFFLQKQGLL